MSVKYKIENAKLNKKLVGDEVTVSKIKKPHGDGPRHPRSAPAWFKEFQKQNNKQLSKLGTQILNIQKDVKNIQQTLKRNNIV